MTEPRCIASSGRSGGGQCRRRDGLRRRDGDWLCHHHLMHGYVPHALYESDQISSEQRARAHRITATDEAAR